MRTFHPLMVTISVAAAAYLLTTTAVAQSSADSAAAQGLFDEAKALMAAGKASEACPKFEESQRLDPGSGTLLNLARCYEETGRIASAWTTYLDAAASARAAGSPDREQGAKERAAELAPRVSRLRVKVAPEARVAGLEILRDGSLVGPAQWGVAIPANQGPHEITARAPGRREWTGSVDVKGEGTMTEIDIPPLHPPLVDMAGAPKPVSEPQSPASAEERSSGLGTQKTIALIAGGVGVAGLAMGTVFGLKAMGKKSDADKACSGNTCATDAAVAAGNDAHSAGNVATIGMVVGAVGLASGLALWFTAPKEGPAMQAGVGVGTVQVRGVW